MIQEIDTVLQQKIAKHKNDKEMDKETRQNYPKNPATEC